MGPTVAATFCATLVDEWARAGCTDAVVAPGSRSTPLALALLADERVRVHVFHDERVASFVALGLGLAGGRPAPLLCTSGTAAAHFHAAVVEADLSDVPMLVCTADRPPELWQVGAPQTIDQTRLYGTAARFVVEPGAPDEAARASWRSLAARSVVEALGGGGRPGPVHLNLPFRDPLVGEPGDLPPGRDDGGPWHRGLPAANAGGIDPEALDRLAALVDGRRGVVVAGAGIDDVAGVGALADRLGWPVLADHRSGCRGLAAAVAHADPILRAPAFAAARDETRGGARGGARPEVVLRLGEPLSSKVVNRWLADARAVEVAVERHGRWRDPDRAVSLLVRAEPGHLARRLAERLTGPPSDEIDRWTAADRRAGEAIAGTLDAEPDVTEPAVLRAALDAVPPGGALVVASSMPVRDLEWFGGRRDDVAVFANRGANGIDGVVSTAIGVALSGRPTVCVLGDVAFLHDSTALIGLARRPIDLAVVVIDNDGGGIFSFLPQADLLGAEAFEALFGTPHGTDLALLAEAHGVAVDAPERRPEATADAVGRAVSAGGVRVVRVRTDRDANVAVHRRLEQQVIAALG